MPRRSPFTSVTPALSIATSVPVPMAMPTCACASAGRVVDAVARHGDHAPADLQRPDRVQLLLGQHLRDHLLDAELAAHRVGGRARVAREHDDAHAHGLRGPSRLPGGCLDRIGHGDDRGVGRRSPRTWRSGLARARLRPSQRAPWKATRVSISRCLPTRTGGQSTVPSTPLPGDGFEVSTVAERIPLSPRLTIAWASGCSLTRSRLGDQRQHFLLGDSADDELDEPGRPTVSVPVLSTTRVSTSRIFSMASASRNSTPFVAPCAHRHRDGHRRREPHGAGTGDDQHRDGVDEA